MSLSMNVYANNPLPYASSYALPYGIPVADYPAYASVSPAMMAPAYTVTTMPANLLVPPPIYTVNPYAPTSRQYPGSITKQVPYNEANARSPHRRNIPLPYLASYYNRPNDYTPAVGLPTQAPPLLDLTEPQDGTGNPLMRYYLTPPRYEGVNDPVPTTLPLNYIVRPSTVPMSHANSMNSEPRLSSFYESPQQIERPYIQMGELDMFPKNTLGT
jgi:hypothetical protein